MTMQRPDEFIYRGRKASAIAISKEFDFTPGRVFGIPTISWITSNHRGFWCDYVIDEAFVIRTLSLVSKGDSYPAINGIKAEPVPEYMELYENHIKPRHPTMPYTNLPMRYVGLNYTVDYTGSVVIAVSAADDEGDDHILELEFENGMLVHNTDITELWEKVHNVSADTASAYWWQNRENNYYHLINYGLMGITR